MVLLLGLLLTGAVTAAAVVDYGENEQRLTTLQTKLTGSILQSAQPELQATLGRIVGLTAAGRDPVATFETAMKDELSPKGPFSSATMSLVHKGSVQQLSHVGLPSVRSPHSKATVGLILQSARSPSLVTTRVVAGHFQRLAYLLSADSSAGIFVVATSQQLPTDFHLPVRAGSPEAGLNLALYFGRTASSGSLIATTDARLPLTGSTATTTVPFGNNVLLLIGSPKGSLAGVWAEFLPWIILVFGVVLSIGAAILTQHFAHRRKAAEILYREQRKTSEDLQHSLLPKRMPAIPGWEFSARYLPATRGAEIGGDWYSVVEIDDTRFAVVVGDVSGHDMEAAGIMAAVRYTIRALATAGIPPNEILARASTELEVVSDTHFATALVGIVDTTAEEITVASAGHCPPLLVHENQAAFLPVEVGRPLGLPGSDRPDPVTARFLEGSMLIAFTDGLIERRGESLDVGMERVAEIGGGHSGSPDELVDNLLTTLIGDEREDDIALLVVQFCGSEPDRRVSPEVNPSSSRKSA